MILKVSHDQALARRHRHVTQSGALTHIETYLGTNSMELAAQGKSIADMGKEHGPYPMAFAVEQAPDSVVQPHFHEADQFQLFIAGSGRIGTHPLEGLAVHYAGAHSPYGPIAAGPEGVTYLTLRRSWDKGAQWMPQAMSVLREVPTRKYVAFTSPPLERHPDTASLRGLSLNEVMPYVEGGPGAWQVRAGPGTAVDGPAHGPGGGQFWFLLSGSLNDGTSTWGAKSCFFVDRGEAARGMVAGDEGVELLLVQFAS